MKRIILLVICLLLVLSACSASTESDQPAPTPTSSPTPAVSPSPSPTAAPQPESSAKSEPSTSPESTEAETSNILIAYFTWAENTVVEDPSSVDVDATTSASVLLPGNAAKLAGWIQQEVGGDLFSIVVDKPYSSDYDECLDCAADEKAQNARPALVNHVEDMSRYDVVFLGFPNWWYTVPMAVHTFLEEYDFSGKTIVPFVTHGTGGLASTIEDITANLPKDVTILEPIGIYRPDVDGAQGAVQEWLEGLEIS